MVALVSALIAFPELDPERRARMLVRHGYGVLLFDPRGRGPSSPKRTTPVGSRHARASTNGASSASSIARCDRHSDMETRISRAGADHVEVRGFDLTGDLMGRLTFTQYFHLLVLGREPTAEETAILDVLLLAIAEHGLMPSNVVARTTYAAAPESLQGAVAAGILGAGSVILGAAEDCARLLVDVRERGADVVVRELHARGARVPGFGHPLHKPLDPRAERIFELAPDGEHLALARELRGVVHEVYGKPLTLNVSLPIAAVLLDLGYPVEIVKGVPILARTASLLAHIAEEQRDA
jgi:citrate synthase